MLSKTLARSGRETGGARGRRLSWGNMVAGGSAITRMMVRLSWRAARDDATEGGDASSEMSGCPRPRSEMQ
jgi:hypothetical protein